MKKLILLILSCISVSGLFAQKELHIHHINIENGDATVVGIFNVATQKYTAKILIDGGMKSAKSMLLPYLKEMMGTDEASLHFNYVVLTHYHTDHFNGLLALEDGSITADSIIDPGGYDMGPVFGQALVGGQPPENMKVDDKWTDALTIAAHHSPKPYVKGHSKVMLRYGTDAGSNIGNKVTLGKIGSNNVELRVIAGWGNTLSENGEIVPNPSPGKNNPNNFTLGFMLSCGEFRYFMAGDMGGSGGSYIDQETTVTRFLLDEYPRSLSWDRAYWAPGHVCGFKANHHGSNHSNNADFMNDMFPAVTVTSAGSHGSWCLPHYEYIERLREVEPLSSGPVNDSSFIRGVYFTNLNDYKAPNRSKAICNELFSHQPGICYDYGNNSSAAKGSYLIKVKQASSLRSKSSFEVGRVDIDKERPYTKLAHFFCHTR